MLHVVFTSRNERRTNPVSMEEEISILARYCDRLMRSTLQAQLIMTIKVQEENPNDWECHHSVRQVPENTDGKYPFVGGGGVVVRNLDHCSRR